MKDLTSEDFSDFFRDVHGHGPFPWQQRLTTQVLEEGKWPRVIDLPTGTGKTAVLDTAVFAMAVRPDVSPRRVVFVIDRRIVVDQVYQRARKIRDRVKSGATPTLRLIQERLQALSDGEHLLDAAMLRGGIPIGNEWAQRPDQPWVVVSTVDQFGSRLLFRGYGVRPGMRPIHAGLTGNDCLVILDEVHLSVPFSETLERVSALASDKLPKRFSVVEMSATPNTSGVKPFSLDPVDDLENCEELRRRVKAVKRAKLLPVPSAKDLPNAILKIIRSITKKSSDEGEGIGSVGIVVNRVKTARETYRAIAEAGEKAGYETHLVTGRMRPLDRVDILNEIMPKVDANRKDGVTGGLTVVVATQAIEVGADFSFDALITECAAVDSIRQRFGRLDRRGLCFAQTGTAAQAWILGSESAFKKPDPIYGDSVKVTWEGLKKRRAKDGLVDVSPCALLDFPDEATAPKGRAPLLLKTHMDAWVQTRPEPIVQPSVEWFLHGIEKETRQQEVTVLWRWDRSAETLGLVPPRAVEFLQIPINAAKSWLSVGREEEVADVPMSAESGEHDTRQSNQSSPGNAYSFVRWEGFGRDPEPIGTEEIRPGDVLVLDPRQGGLSAGTWDPSSVEEVRDLGDEAQISYGRKATLRLHPNLLGTVSSPPSPTEEIDADSSARERISRWLEQEQYECPEGHWMKEAIDRLRNGFEFTPVRIRTNDSYYVLSQHHASTKKPVVDAAVMDGSDASGSLTGTGVTLHRHLDGVGQRAGKIAKRLGLDAQLVDDLRLAGRLHDIGKVDTRFQSCLVGGDPVKLDRLKEPLAKSLPKVRKIRTYPEGMRHELASVALAESNPAVLNEAHDRDLVLHLVGTHHGWGRPLPPIIEDPKPCTLVYQHDGHTMEANSDLTDSSLALDMADRFWRLVECYGYHGLAWLEAILRLSDHLQSAEESEKS